ncbi:UDP-galactopyranose mutase [bacterium C-53]|nr:UDP-galactopyranose mutase [Lachnospiraceae bacterium]NBI02599.1 UDP-galactopyranose mutase [Lachnospiraceae bacterium]RKJ11241.1 UDP-galactopyranose mutase [bacterium C-53]
MYDFLLIGAGLFNAVFAHEASKRGKTCLVLEKRNHIGGNCYTEKVQDIIVHKYGAHIFRTSDIEIWNYMQQFAVFNHFINSPVAKYKGELYNLPFNMNTFSRMWNISTPEEAKDIIKSQSKEMTEPAQNLEEHVLGLVGIDIYEKLIKGYTEKQWGKKCVELPPSIMRRIPLRFTYDNNYFNDPYQGIPIGGYTPVLEQMFGKCEVICDTDYLQNRDQWNSKAERIVYTGTIDSYYNYKFGELEYRSLRFESEALETDNYQGVAVVNYTDIEVPYTRIIEHKHFAFGQQDHTIISKEYPLKWEKGIEPYYPINDERNMKKYSLYKECADCEANIYFGGRLGEYRYYDMQDTIKAALKLAQKIL